MRSFKSNENIHRKEGGSSILHQGLSEPEFYDDLLYKFKKIVGRADFSDQFRKIIICYKPGGRGSNRDSAPVCNFKILENDMYI